MILINCCAYHAMQFETKKKKSDPKKLQEIIFRDEY